MSANRAEQAQSYNESSELTPGQQARGTSNIQEVMREIRERIRLDVENNLDKRRVFAAYQADSSKSEYKAGDLLHSPKLLFLNQYCARADHFSSDHFQSHRPGLIGKVVTRIKRKVHAILFQLLDRYFSAERDFQTHLVQHLNDSARYVDARDMSNFWELIRKIDYDVQKALDRIERIHDEQMGSLRTQEKWLNETVQSNVIQLRDTVSRHNSEIQTLESVARGLESIVSRVKQPVSLSANPAVATLPQAEESQAGAKHEADFSYLLLENRYRGSEEEISKRLEIYPAYFKSASKPVLEIGPGRGELLKLLGKQNISAYGVDIDLAMVQAANAAGLDARAGDGIAHLRTLPDHSIGGLIAIQVVEHLQRHQLEELFALSLQKIEPGGRVIFETINPRSLLALSSNYFRDPTHVWPLHPDTLEYAMNLSGLKTVEVKFLSEVAREAQLRELKVEEYMSPRLSHTIQTINRNFEQLNSLLYGAQDYCIIAEVPR